MMLEPCYENEFKGVTKKEMLLGISCICFWVLPPGLELLAVTR